MKKFFFLAVLTALFVTAPASAQVKFGLKGGLNVTDMSLSQEVFDVENRAGFFVGPTLKVSLPISGLGVDIAALYDQRSAKVKDADETLEQQSVQIPVNVRLGFGVGSTVSAFVFAGPQFGFNVGKDEFNWKNKENYDETFQLKKSNISVNVGLGVTLMSHLQVSANYNIACGKTAEYDQSSSAKEAIKGIRARNNAWQIALAYYF